MSLFSQKNSEILNRDLVTIGKTENASAMRDFAITVVLVCVCLFVLWTKFVWLEPIQVDGISMSDTLIHGDMLVLDRLASPDYGDVVVFTKDGTSYIKRVVALGGDSVRLCGGKVYLKKKGEDGYKLLSEDYAKGSSFMYYYDTNNRRIHTTEEIIFDVKEGEFFAMGDNREHSIDCRDKKLGGALSLEYLDGVVHQFFIAHKDDLISQFYRYL